MTFQHDILFSTLSSNDGDSIFSKELWIHFHVISINNSVFNNKVCLGTFEGKSYIFFQFVHLEKFDNSLLICTSSWHETNKCVYDVQNV